SIAPKSTARSFPPRFRKQQPSLELPSRAPRQPNHYSDGSSNQGAFQNTDSRPYGMRQRRIQTTQTLLRPTKLAIPRGGQARELQNHGGSLIMGVKPVS